MATAARRQPNWRRSNGDQVGVRFACAGRADRKAVALGDRYTNTLGLLTPPDYRKAAEDGGLLAAVEADEALGYAPFGLPKRSTRIRLAHLRVAEEQRGRGIARRLVEGIKERYPQRLGSKAKCRRDYNLSGMWRSLGSVPDGEVQGGTGTAKSWMDPRWTSAIRTCSRRWRAMRSWW
ncbi:GNAT family N-acetyltransferase [Streptomyces sp. NPDC001852]|uniref:GNAT family N-acetyltransferase n=1 Tax=Streptomyces sp. NPDC001852 TaxID=3364619 RepID=UPI0036BDA7B3